MGNCQGGKPHTSATYELPPDKFNSLDVFCKQLEIRPGTLTKLRVAFTKIDHDKSGCVSMAEFLVLFGLDRTPVSDLNPPRSFAPINVYLPITPAPPTPPPP